MNKATSDRLPDTDRHAIVAPCLAHSEPLSRGVSWCATADQLDTLARMLDRGGIDADAEELRRYVRVCSSRP